MALVVTRHTNGRLLNGAGFNYIYGCLAAARGMGIEGRARFKDGNDREEDLAFP